MIAEIAIAALAASWIADFTQRDRTRILLGQWGLLFENKGIGWAADMVHHLRKTEKKSFGPAWVAFNHMLTKKHMIHDRETALDVIKAKYSELLGKIVYTTWVENESGEPIELEHPIPVRILKTQECWLSHPDPHPGSYPGPPYFTPSFNVKTLTHVPGLHDNDLTWISAGEYIAEPM